MNKKTTTAGILSLLLVFVLFFTACPTESGGDGGSGSGSGGVSLPSEPAPSTVPPAAGTSFPATKEEALQLFKDAMSNYDSSTAFRNMLNNVLWNARNKAAQDQQIATNVNDASTDKSYSYSINIPVTLLVLKEVNSNMYRDNEGKVSVKGSYSGSWSSNLTMADYNTNWPKWTWNNASNSGKYIGTANTKVGDNVTTSESYNATYTIADPISLGDYQYAGTITAEFNRSSKQQIEKIEPDTWVATISSLAWSRARKIQYSLTISSATKGAVFVVTAADSNSSQSRYAASSETETRYSELKVYDGGTLKYTIPYDNDSNNINVFENLYLTD